MTRRTSKTEPPPRTARGDEQPPDADPDKRGNEDQEDLGVREEDDDGADRRQRHQTAVAFDKRPVRDP